VAKIMMSAVLCAVLIRMVDDHFYFGRYTDAAIMMAREILRSLGI